ncbi:F0F1 ATP synthase subunit B [Spirosoma utsteinense]|uniref:ATP synthase subunit b n=1 Tax=Spirosoma utsteinense TaxID=2585773 RepID=A0ABR6W9Z4_9BACT|nr:F0F1 ATP synthase subunit B [Spirosoma utsteinense]MBC3786721.1 F-type H+-transporting ATPase subunit b [Spirosoma utsteinense]MBC3793337.1 F-type H+-transporting ATPase subunit b [Spirosoma utsteinense]
MDLLTPDLGLLFWQVVVFLALFLILRTFAWKPITDSLHERENNIQSALDLAEKTRIEMTALKADNEKLLVQARSEREAILRGAKETADKMVADSRERAAIEGQRMLEQAREAMQNERQALVAQMKKEVVTLSIDIAEKVLRKELSDKTSQEKLVSDLVSNSRLN